MKIHSTWRSLLALFLVAVVPCAAGCCLVPVDGEGESVSDAASDLPARPIGDDTDPDKVVADAAFSPSGR